MSVELLSIKFKRTELEKKSWREKVIVEMRNFKTKFSLAITTKRLKDKISMNSAFSNWESIIIHAT